MKVRTIHNMLLRDAQWLRSILEFASQAGFPSRLSGDAFWEWWVTDLDGLEERSKMEVMLLGYPENLATFWLRCVYVAKPDGSVPQSWLTVDCPAPLSTSDWEGSLRQAQDDFRETLEFEARFHGTVSDADVQSFLRLSMGKMDEDEAALSRAVRTISGFTVPRGVFIWSAVQDATRRAAKLLSLSPPRVANWLCCFSAISRRGAAQPFIAGFPQCEFQIVCPRLPKLSYMQERMVSETRMEFDPLTRRLEPTKVVYEVPIRFAGERADKVALPPHMVNPHPILSQKHRAKVGRTSRGEQIERDVRRFKSGEVDFEALVREEWQSEFDQNGDLAWQVSEGSISVNRAKTRIYWRVKRRLAKGGAKPLKLSPGWRSRLKLPGSLEI